MLELEHLIQLKHFEALPNVRQKLGQWQIRLNLITEDGWQRPVKQSVLSLLNQSFTDLDEGKHRLAANHLKQASWLI